MTPEVPTMPTPTPTPTPTPRGVGHVAYTLADDRHVYRIAAIDPPVREDVSATLAALGAGEDSTLALSRDGRWAAVTTTRLGCAGFECLALVPVDDNGVQPGGARVALAGGARLHPADRPAVGADAALLVFTAGGGPHARDLWRVRGTAGSYDAPVLLTAQSTFDFNLLPSLTRDERAVVFDCSPSGQADSVSLCRVDLDGGGFQRLLAPTDGPGGAANDEVHSAGAAPDDTLVFESSWHGERIWRRDAAGALAQIGDYNNDNTPCVLPDGRIASLWLNAPAGNGGHQLKVMSADGARYQMLEPADILDIGLSCSE
jgi:hypothetical protein